MARDDKDAKHRKAMHDLQVELTGLQRHVITEGLKVLVIFEGRDAAGKDGTIKRIVEHLSPREVRMVALGKPSDRDNHSWYFQRWVRHLPAAGEIVLFNRSWYNRAGVEHVMGFCTPDEYRAFLDAAPLFEQMLIGSGMTIIKYYLDISRDEQKRRLKDRARDPLKQWKLSPVDAVASKKWKEYSAARNVMLDRTHTPFAPWTIVRADDKRATHINVIRHLLSRFEFRDKSEVALPDPENIFTYHQSALEDGLMAK